LPGGELDEATWRSVDVGVGRAKISPTRFGTVNMRSM
jgi:hypothetical protein